MFRSKTTASVLLAGLLAAAGVHAQSTSSASSNVPLQAGEASTVSHGAPNLAPSAVAPQPVPDTGTLGAPADTTVVPAAPAYPAAQITPAEPAGRVVPRNGANVTSNVPAGSGEASTMTNGVPNARTENAVTSDARVLHRRGTEIATVPDQAGEASTMVNGQPNANPDDPIVHRRAAMGYGTAPETWTSPRVTQ